MMHSHVSWCRMSSDITVSDYDALSVQCYYQGAPCFISSCNVNLLAPFLNMRCLEQPVCEVEATFDHAASNRKAQETEQMSASTTGVKQGRGLLSGFGSWFGMGGKQGAAPEASGPLTEVDIVSEATSISATPGKGTTRSSFDVGLIHSLCLK